MSTVTTFLVVVGLAFLYLSLSESLTTLHHASVLRDFIRRWDAHEVAEHRLPSKWTTDLPTLVNWLELKGYEHVRESVMTRFGRVPDGW